MSYVVVTIFQIEHDGTGGINIECYGPFKTKAEAKLYAKGITYRALIMIENLYEAQS